MRWLQKTAPLTAEEWRIMRKHPEYANEMLSRLLILCLHSIFLTVTMKNGMAVDIRVD